MATTEQNHSPLIPPFDQATAWMPLEGLIEQWGIFGAEATTSSALQATSLSFAALARETEALDHRTNAHLSVQEVDGTNFEHCLHELVQAQTQWTNAIHTLELLLIDEQNTDTFRDALSLLVAETMEQRLRVSTLIQEVEQEQLGIYRRTLPSQHQLGDHDCS